MLGWATYSKVFQLSNVQHIHRKCLEKEPHVLLPTEGVEDEPTFEPKEGPQHKLL